MQSYTKIMRKGYIWYYFKHQHFSLMVPPKCGATSIRKFIETVQDDEIIKIKHYAVCGKVYAVVRHPLDKFCSLWRSMCRDKIGPQEFGIHDMTPTELMDHIEGGAKDIHWTPQIDLHGKLEPTLIPLAMLGFWWKQSGLGSLGKHNMTDGDIEMDEKLRDRVLTFYADDVILHNQAELDFCWDTCRKLNIQ